MNEPKRLPYLIGNIAIVFGLLWLGHWLYPIEKWNWLTIVAMIWALELLILPAIAGWLKKIIKEAMREKESEDAKIRSDAAGG